ncbi:MAG: aspartate aminotransferase family protein [Myxococcota bacterium]|nr:aspartate aminotransferase family protein [Myxococcota bacterium]
MSRFTRKERNAHERSLLEKTGQFLPSGVRTPSHSGAHAMVVESGHGCWLRDVSGNEYLDYLMGSGPLLLGHAHPAVVEAVSQRISRGSSYLMVNESAIELAEAVAQTVPCAEKVAFNNSGSESTFFALRMARAFTGKEKTLKFEGAFHGMHDYALMSNQWTPTPGEAHAPVPNSAGIAASIEKDVIIAPWNDLETTERLLREHASELAAVILEPLQRTLPPETGFLERIREITHELGIVLVFDEVVTGYRLALGGAQEYYGVVPDLATVCKGIASGFPISILCGRADILDHADPRRLAQGDHVHMTGTFSGNSLSCTAALATLHELRRPGTYEGLFEKGRRLMQGLSEAMSHAGVPCQVTGEPPAFQPWFSDSVVRNFRDMLNADPARNLRFTELLLDRGILKAHEKFFVSTAHGDKEIEITLEAYREVAEALASAG